MEDSNHLNVERRHTNVSLDEETTPLNISFEDEERDKVPELLPHQRKNFKIAAFYIENAKIGRQSECITSEKELKYYHIYYHPIIVITIKTLLMAILLLGIFEEPAVPGLELPWGVTMSFEFILLIFFSLRIVHMKLLTPPSKFKKDFKVIILINVIILTLIDMVIFAGLKMANIKIIRWSRILRPLFMINFPVMRQIRRSFRNMRRTLPDVFSVLVLLFFSLAVFALMAFKLLSGKNLKYANGQPYFSSYWNSVFELYVLITTANNPDVMMPAFDQNKLYFLFFMIFMIVCFFIYMNIILAVIYNNYRKHLKNEVKKSIMSKHRQLSRAFDLLYIHQGRRQVVTKKTFYELMETLPEKRSPSLINVFWIILDTENSNVIGRREFIKLADLLNVEVMEVKHNPSFCVKHFPFLYNSKCSLHLQEVVKSRYFNYFFDLLTIANAIVIGVAKPTSKWDDTLEWVFVSFFMMEIILKFYLHGVKKFFSQHWNIFDFFVIGSAFILGILQEILKEVSESRLSLDVLLVLRILRLLKVIGRVKRFKMVIETINKILPSLFSYGTVILIIYYVFAIVGMEIFGGRIQYLGYDTENFCGNKNLNGSDFWNAKYCNNNFNDLLQAFIILFELTVVNQWHVIAYGFAAVTNPVARLYFMIFHMTCVIVVLNIITAFVLEAFILEYFASQSDLESEIERKIHEIGLSTRSEKKRRQSMDVSFNNSIDEEDEESSDEEKENGIIEMDDIKIGKNRRESAYVDRSKDTPVRFVISKKIKSVEVLLQKMFEKELSDELLEEEMKKFASEEEIVFDRRRRRTNIWSQKIQMAL